LRGAAPGIDFYQIAKTQNRTIGSIIARLLKLEKIGPHTPLDMFDPKGGICAAVLPVSSFWFLVSRN